MNIRQRAARTAAVSTVIASAVFALAAVGTATATPEAGEPAGPTAEPAFLSGTQLPPHASSPWYESEVTGGLPETPVFCLGDVLTTAQDASHRTFWTDLDTSAVQVTVRADSVAEARAIAAQAEDAVRGCADVYEQQYPGAEADLGDFGKVPVRDGGHVYGVDTAHPEGATDVHLFGIGRDGSTVTVVAWGQMGDFDQAPVGDFRATTRTALAKLYG